MSLSHLIPFCVVGIHISMSAFPPTQEIARTDSPSNETEAGTETAEILPLNWVRLSSNPVPYEGKIIRIEGWLVSETVNGIDELVLYDTRESAEYRKEQHALILERGLKKTLRMIVGDYKDAPYVLCTGVLRAFKETAYDSHLGTLETVYDIYQFKSGRIEVSHEIIRRLP